MNTFCVLPWYSREIENKQTVACCLLPKKHDIELIKTDLLGGIRTPSCSACWNIESKGKISRRQLENSFLDFKLNRDISLIQNDCITNNHNINLYQVKTSNLCNQACVSCSSNFSTKWSEIDRKMGNIPIKNFILDVDSLDINFYTAKRITLLGGEPFFDSATFIILKKLIESNNSNCFVSLVTNGSIQLSAQQLDLLSKFSDLNICVSIDGIGPVFEYTRWPGKWKTLIKNLDQYRAVAKNVSVSYTISSLNALYYDQTVDWFKENNLNYNHNIVYNPDWLNLKNMPIKLKHQLANTQNFVTDFCNITGSEISVETIRQHIRCQDRAKKIDIKDYMPEFWHLLND